MVERILYIINEKGLTCSYVEKSLGFGNGSIKRFKTSSPSIDKVVALSDFLNVSLEWLVKGTGEIYKDNKDDNIEDNSITTLLPVERNLIKIYRELDDDSQCKFIDYAYELKAKLKSKLSKSKTIYNDETTSTSETEIA